MRDLVDRARSGDHEAFARLLAERADRLYAVAYLMTRSRDAAEDALQDASLRAWRDLPRLRQPDRFDPWIRRLVVNASIDSLRRQRRRPQEVTIESVHDPAAADISAYVAEHDALTRAFARLSPDHRAVVVLSHFEGLTTAEVASTLEIPHGTVKSRLHHALRALRAAMDADARIPQRSSDANR